jgi:hypothetical protein
MRWSGVIAAKTRSGQASGGVAVGDGLGDTVGDRVGEGVGLAEGEAQDETTTITKRRIGASRPCIASDEFSMGWGSN